MLIYDTAHVHLRGEQGMYNWPAVCYINQSSGNLMPQRKSTSLLKECEMHREINAIVK